MAVGFVASATSGSQASVASFSIGTLGTGARAGIVFVAIHNSATDIITSVTWNGVAMTLLYKATDTDTEPGVVKAYFLDNVTNGTITVNRTNNAVVTVGYAASISTASLPAYVSQVITRVASTQNTNADTSTTGTGASGEVAVDDGSPGSSSMRFAAAYSGAATPPLQGTNSSALQVLDSTAFGSRFVREATAGQGSRSVGFATGTTDDWAGVYVAVSEANPQTITLGLLDASPALYAPSLSHTIAVPFLDASPALYAPTIVGLAASQSITLGLLDASNALYAPTVIIDQFLTIPLLDSGSALYAPAVLQIQYIDLGVGATFLDDSFTDVDGTLLDAHTAEVGGTWVKVPGNDDIEVFGGVARPVASGVTSPYLIGSPATANYEVTIRARLNIAPIDSVYIYVRRTTDTFVVAGLDNLEGDVVFLGHSVAGSSSGDSYGGYTTGDWAELTLRVAGTLATVLIDGAVIGTRVVPVMAAGQVALQMQGNAEVDWASGIDLHLIDSGPALYAPTLQATNTVTLGLLDASNALYAPTVIQDQFITLGLLDSGPAVYAPTVSPQAVTISLGLLDASPAVYAPTLTVGAVTISLGLLDSEPALYSPTLAQPAGAAQGITLDLLDAGNATYAPTLTVGAVGLTIPLLDGSPAVYAPTLYGYNTITIGLLDAASALYAPSLSSTQIVALGLLDGAPAVFAPTLSFVGEGGASGKRVSRRGQMRAAGAARTSVTITINAVVAAPTVAAVLEVNDDEVVLELLAGIL